MSSQITNVMAAMEQLNPEERKAAAADLLRSFPLADRREVVQAAGLGPPNQGTANFIWITVVICFALVLIASAASLLYGVVFLQRTIDSILVVLTVFTAVVGFLAGLLAPSPFQWTQSPAQ
jgi:hypothetical protein